MEVEIEAKFLGVDVGGLRARLQALGATLVHPERLMRRYNFDYPDARLEAAHGWVRLRDEGDRVTLAYKQSTGRTLHGMSEVSVVVSDLARARSFVEAVGLVTKGLQETKRERWELQQCEVTIDTWPWVPGFVELEGPSEHVVRSAATALGFSFERALYGSVEIVYQQYFNVTEREIQCYPELTFGPVPAWLEAKRKR